MNLARFLLHLGAPLALLGLWLSPVPVESRSAPPSVARSETDHHARGALSALAGVGTQAPIPRTLEGPTPALGGVAVPVHRHASTWVGVEALLPLSAPCARAHTPLYQVRRSGQAHRSAP